VDDITVPVFLGDVNLIFIDTTELFLDFFFENLAYFYNWTTTEAAFSVDK
jgi:hypothetical protein